MEKTLVPWKLNFLTIALCILTVSRYIVVATTTTDDKEKEKKGKPQILNNLNGDLNIPSDMPTEHRAMIQEKYAEFMKQRGDEKKKKQQQEKQTQDYPKPPEGIVYVMENV